MYAYKYFVIYLSLYFIYKIYRYYYYKKSSGCLEKGRVFNDNWQGLLPLASDSNRSHAWSWSASYSKDRIHGYFRTIQRHYICCSYVVQNALATKSDCGSVANWSNFTLFTVKNVWRPSQTEPLIFISAMTFLSRGGAAGLERVWCRSTILATNSQATDMNLAQAHCLTTRAPTPDFWLEITKSRMFVIQGFVWITKF
jgi:hypothetical protein